MRQIEIQQLTSPLDESACVELTTFLWHKGSPWIDDIRRRFQGSIEGATDRFFVARDAGRLVGHAWYTTSADNVWLGLVGHVYTDPQYRRQGIAQQLMDAALADFQSRGGTIMQLFTSTPYSIAFYERLGFENRYANQAGHETDWYMCRPAGSRDIVNATLHSRGPEIRALAPGDLPAYCLLYNHTHRDVLKDWAQRIGLGLEAELAFIQAWQKLAAGMGTCYVLANDRMIVGLASLMRFEFPHQSHVAALDVYVIEEFAQQAKTLLDACLARRDQLGIEFIYAAAVGRTKQQLLSQFGFRETTDLPRHYHVAGTRFDLRVYQYP